MGPNRKLLTIHSALIAHHSETLGVLVNGKMSETKEGCALLDDDEESTFVRFSQYAYTGDYIAADPDIQLHSSFIASTHPVPNEAFIDVDSEEAPPPASPAAPDDAPRDPEPEPTEEPAILVNNNDPWGAFLIPKKDKKKAKGRAKWADDFDDVVPKNGEPAALAPRSKKSELWENFKSKAYATSKPAFQPRKNRESCEDYTEVFLCHARLYVFANKYNVGPLRELSLHKLQRTLAEFTLYEERIGDIVNLLRYSYVNTAGRSESVDDLRLLVVHYSACVVEDLSQSDEFQLLLEEVGSLARDLVKQMLQRLD